MYDLPSYGQMVTNGVRGQAYAAALKQAVKPGSVMVEIGTGPGFFAVLAAKLGAKRVYAIEPDNSIEVGRQLAAANNVSERITFIQDVSTRVTLPEPADIILSDLRGSTPLFYPNISSVIDARKRFLRPNGQIIAKRDSIWVSILQSPDTYSKHIGAWGRTIESIDMKAGLKFLTNTWRRAAISEDQFLAEPVCAGTIEYDTVEVDSFDTELSMNIERVGTLHAIGVWFDAELADGIGFSNHPSQPNLVYGRGFYPLTGPILVSEGDLVKIRLRADVVGTQYYWRWDTDVYEEHTGTSKASFRQSDFKSKPLSLEQFKKRTPGFTPELNDSGNLALFILGLMKNNDLTVEKIAQLARTEFPETLHAADEYMRFAGDLSSRFSA